MKPIVAMTSMTLGTAAMTTAAYVTINPAAFVTRAPVPASAFSYANPMAWRETVPESQTQDPPVTFKPLRISGLVRKPSRPTPEVEPQLTACSEWRTLGPTSVSAVGAPGQHRVKLLCPNGKTAQATFFAPQAPRQVESLAGLPGAMRSVSNSQPLPLRWIE